MKVAFVTSFPDDPGAPRGGVEAVSVSLVNSLAALEDLDIHIVTTKRSCLSAKTEKWDGVVIHRLPWAGGSVLRHATGPGRRQVQEYLARIRPDVVHAHDTYGLMVKGMAVPRVFTVHGFIHGDTLVSGERWAVPRAWVWRRIESGSWADQPHIVSISPYVRERLHGIARGVIHDIDNPVAEAFFQIPRNERRATIFSAAVVTPRKNPLALIEAVARLAAEGLGVELRLAGSLDDEAYVRHVRDRMRETGVEGRVSLLGRIDTGQIRRELSAASAFALASLEENSPMGIEEAMAAGVPVVTSNRCGMPYLVRDGESGFLVNPNDPADIARRLKQLLADDELRHSMGAKGKEIALDRFHPAKVAARTRQVYLRAIEDFQRR